MMAAGTPASELAASIEKDGKETVADRKGRIANDAAFSMSHARRDGWGRRPSGVRKLNPYLIDRSGTPLQYGGMTQHRQEKRNDVCG
jgi:hypothetical protein